MRSRNGKSVPAIIFATAMLILECGALAAADPVPVSYTIDLAQPLNTEWSIPDSAKVTLKLIHKIPNGQYNKQYRRYTLAPAGINTDNVFKADQAQKQTQAQQIAPAVLPSNPSLCDLLTAAVQNMKTGNESDVEAHQRVLQNRLDAARGQNCTDEAEADALIAETTEDINISDLFPSIGADEGVLVTITRVSDPNPPPPWVLDIHTGIGNGKFLSNYTFGFALNRDKSYFATTDAKIAEQARRDKATMVPLVLFSWLPRKRATDSWVPSWTAGLGYDLSNPVVAVGAIWTWNRNLGIAVGLLGQKQQRLKGKYHVGDPVAANSESKDLTDPTWGPNLFVGISIRSVSALFK